MAHSPEKSLSPSKRAKKQVTRYGPVTHSDLKFGTEERFQWQKAKYVSDVVYSLPEMRMTASCAFGTSTRGYDPGDGDAKKSSTGPGSYDFAHSFDHLSEYFNRKGNRFGSAPRESMAQKTPSPGAVYNVDKCYYMGPTKTYGIGFNCDNRPPLNAGGSAGANADMFIPKANYGPAITIAGKWKQSKLNTGGPGAIYDVKLNNNSPAFSFGKGKGDRFAPFGFLSED